jgi:tRNA modification GTPase
MDTIFALGSARGKAGISVVRISGPDAFAGLACLTRPVEPRRASLRKLAHGGEALDEAVVLAFPAPQSFTGEDVVELHLHGSLAAVSAVLAALGSFEGFRSAEPGEFTRRALENERFDLAQVEGLADLIEAETEAQRVHALRVLSGELGNRAAGWRSKLVRAAALMEATIDFAEEDVPSDVVPEVRDLLSSVRAELERERDGIGAAERVREGFEVAIVGPPNVGKSTLLNALAGRDAAITSEVAGTTRDVIEVRMDLGGLAVTLLDTAGIRDAEDRIEALGVDLARRRAETADLRVILREAGIAPVLEPRDDDLVLVPKSDLGEGDFSAVTGQGLDRLVADLTSILAGRASGAGLMSRERHRSAIERSIAALGIATDRLENTPELAEFIAEDVRSAVRALESLVGHVDVEHLLDEIFASFCIGK